MDSISRLLAAKDAPVEGMTSEQWSRLSAMRKLELSLFKHYPSYGAVVCRPCKRAVLPSEVEAHLATHAQLDDKDVENLLAAYASYEPKSTAISRFGIPSPNSAPLSTLEVHAGGCKCLEAGCHVITTTHRNMRQHCNESHAISSAMTKGVHYLDKIFYQVWYGPQSGGTGARAHAATYSWEGLFQVDEDLQPFSPTLPKSPDRPSRDESSSDEDTLVVSSRPRRPLGDNDSQHAAASVNVRAFAKNDIDIIVQTSGMPSEEGDLMLSAVDAIFEAKASIALRGLSSDSWNRPRDASSAFKYHGILLQITRSLVDRDQITEAGAFDWLQASYKFHAERSG